VSASSISVSLGNSRKLKTHVSLLCAAIFLLTVLGSFALAVPKQK